MTHKTRFEVLWRDSNGTVWETQADFATWFEAHDYIGEQPDGGFYKVREVTISELSEA